MSQTLKENEVAVDRQQLENLLNEIEIQESEIRQLYDAAIKLMDVIGMVENGEVKKEIFEEGVSIRSIVSGAKSTIGLFITAGVSKKAEEKLTEKFSFFKPLVPLFEKYGHKFRKA